MPQTQRKLRLHAHSPDQALVGTGLGLIAAGLGMISIAPQIPHYPWWFLPAVMITAVLAIVIGVVVLVIGATHRIPVADVERAWDEQLDELRDKSDRAVNELNMSFAMTPKREEFREHWQDYIPHVPMPSPDKRELHEWDAFLANHDLRDIRQFYAFAKQGAGKEVLNVFRRFAVRRYDRFERLRAANAPWFRDWFREEGVEEGAEQIVVALAYMEIAAASRAGFSRGGDLHGGFWQLAERVHPKPLKLPPQANT